MCQMKKIIVVVLLCLFSQYGITQIPDILKSSNQQLIENAVSSGLFVIRQDYRLQKNTGDSASFYGRNGNDYFGRTYSLGVKVENGICTYEKMLNPWSVDDNYRKYIDDESYKPIIFRTEYRPAVTPEYKMLLIDWTEAEVQESLLFVPDSLGDGFMLDYESGKKDGWIVLVTSDGDWTEDDEAPFVFDIYRTSIEIKEDQSSCIIKPPSTTRQILGGIYVCPVVSSVGKLSFLLTGIVEYNDSNWRITKFAENSEIKKYDELNLIQDGGQDRPRKRKGK